MTTTLSMHSQRPTRRRPSIPLSSYGSWFMPTAVRSYVLVGLFLLTAFLKSSDWAVYRRHNFWGTDKFSITHRLPHALNPRQGSRSSLLFWIRCTTTPTRWPIQQTQLNPQKSSQNWLLSRKMFLPRSYRIHIISSILTRVLMFPFLQSTRLFRPRTRLCQP
jgi:hypothetical protein